MPRYHRKGCKLPIIRKSRDGVNTKFAYLEKLSRTREGIVFDSDGPVLQTRKKTCVVPFYTHEFSELSVIKVLIRWKKNWYKMIKHPKNGRVRVTHFICEFGGKNRTMFDLNPNLLPMVKTRRGRERAETKPSLGNAQ